VFVNAVPGKAADPGRS